MRIADVYINLPIKSIAQAFSYIIPEELEEIGAGWRVLVPFGGRTIEGFVVEVTSWEDYQTRADACPVKKLKSVLAPVDEEAWFTPAMIEISCWLADFYLASRGEIMRLFMPGKSGVKIQLEYASLPAAQDEILLLVDVYKQVYETIAAQGRIKATALKTALMDKGYEAAAGQLEKILAGLLRHDLIKRLYQAGHRAKAIYESCLFLPLKLAQSDMEKLSLRKKAQRKLLAWLLAQPDTRDYYSCRELEQQGFSLSVLKAFAASGLGEIRQQRVLRDSYKDFSGQRQKFVLTEAQRIATEEISCQLQAEAYKTFLLYGVTGSGKTLVYMEAAKKARAMGRNVVVLVPEIALTGQLVQSFKTYFSQDIVVIHSRLSINERNDAILRVRMGEAGIVIGARSALFTPLDNIGLIIMDEEQDNSYKQDESPRYHAKVVAKKMAQVHKAVLILGSATPAVETYYHALKGEYGLLSMPERAGHQPLPQVYCADMRQELQQGHKNVISQLLEKLIRDTLAKKQQMILMLNRRGYSTFVMCRSCGEAVKCPQCTMPLVYHRDGRLVCHHCDLQFPVPDECPKCRSRYIKYFGSGTEKLEQELAQLVPEARIVRMDRDTTGSKFAHTEILNKFKAGEFDILLGTQMVAKGHDVPNVTAAGILCADASLNMPDFRAAERVFMLITQTSGRAGRGDIPGHVVVQCYNPEHFAVTMGIAQDYEGFFQREIKIRKALFNPPFSRLVKLIFQDKSEIQAKSMALACKKKFLESFQGNPLHQTAGPAPAMIPRLNGIYRYALLLKTGDLPAVQDFLRQENYMKNMQVMVDIDPIMTS